jgi:hypothetical protein
MTEIQNCLFCGALVLWDNDFVCICDNCTVAHGKAVDSIT